MVPKGPAQYYLQRAFVDGTDSRGLVRVVLIGVGSNEGESLAILAAAVRGLAQFAEPGSLRCSRVWRTSPVDCPPESPDFLNAAVAFSARSGLTPESLLAALKSLERRFGREAKPVRNAPRSLDLDLLLFDEESRNTDWFTLPHPRATERMFVLAPAAEVAPDVRWPGTGITVEELLRRLESDEQVEPVAILESAGDC
jgi:2-amino-4-hydroxy-6-hydroxymethyldihydropteridine diphosphokinase